MTRMWVISALLSFPTVQAAQTVDAAFERLTKVGLFAFGGVGYSGPAAQRFPAYGFRPLRGQHQALDEVVRVICTRPTGWVLEIDVTAYFDSIVREQLMEMIEKRVRDRSVLRLIRKWIQVGVIEEGRLLVSETGTGQDRRSVRSWPIFTCTMCSMNGSRTKLSPD
jgi:hypothetical protein